VRTAEQFVVGTRNYSSEFVASHLHSVKLVSRRPDCLLIEEWIDHSEMRLSKNTNAGNVT
jgi:hypothetical protein